MWSDPNQPDHTVTARSGTIGNWVKPNGAIDPATLLSAGARANQISVNEWVYSLTDSSGLSHDGVLMVELNDGKPVGYDIVEVVLPPSLHDTATKILNRFARSFNAYADRTLCFYGAPSPGCD